MPQSCYRLGIGNWSPLQCWAVHRQHGRTHRSAVMFLVV
jgi:hypothetical protein